MLLWRVQDRKLGGPPASLANSELPGAAISVIHNPYDATSQPRFAAFVVDQEHMDGNGCHAQQGNEKNDGRGLHRDETVFLRDGEELRDSTEQGYHLEVLSVSPL